MLDGIFCFFSVVTFLPVESNKVSVRGCAAELPNHRGDLSAVVCAMVDEMLERLPQHITHRLAFEV